MTRLSSDVQSDFWGKDGMIPFVGQVEDVEDPKMSNRVKVRCVGHHPKEKTGEKGLATENLPWAHVGMPTTHAQQGRIGGTHGLLPGSWVMGFFMDGMEAQKPFVFSTFNFTARSTDGDNRTSEPTKDAQEGFNKPKMEEDKLPNSGRNTPQETSQGYGHDKDKAGDTFTGMMSNESCGETSPDDAPMQGQAEKERMESKRTEQSPSGQESDNTQGDGMCGSVPHARDDIRVLMAERLPSVTSRFAYGDAVWSATTGKYMDLNGILAKIAITICNFLKQPINSSRAFDNELRRALQVETIAPGGLTRDRVGNIVDERDRNKSAEDDRFNAIFQQFIDQLCGMILNMLQAMNNGGANADGNNAGGNIGANPGGVIEFPDSQCVADTIVNNVNIMTEAALEAAGNQARNSSNDDFLGEIASILSALQPVMQFVMDFKYTSDPEAGNAAGPGSQDALTKDLGCRTDRIYNTSVGAIGAAMGAAGGASGSGGGGGGSSNENSFTERAPHIGFGGLNADEISDTQTNLVCDEALVPSEPVLDRDGNLVEYTGKGDQAPYSSKKPYKPNGVDADVIAVSLPSSEVDCARNFLNGTPNQLVIQRTGRRYYFNNPKDPNLAFPSVYIRGYKGSPVPVVDKASGELVAILTNCQSWDPNNPNANVSVIPNTNPIGITTDDTDFDIVLGGFLIQNTGFDYCEPYIRIFDRDKQTENNAEAKLIINEGRIVDYEIINNGTGFKRLPEVTISDRCSGFGAKLIPIMSVVARPNAKPLPAPVNAVYCPSKNQRNLY
jgi:hypothetical protein